MKPILAAVVIGLILHLMFGEMIGGFHWWSFVK